ncbi:hypothetical protein ABID99_003440 [Mucilaginibacter sp. OAE612]
MASQLARSAPTYFKDRAPVDKNKAWMNHCPHCNHVIRNELLYGWEGYFLHELTKKEFNERTIEAPQRHFFPLLTRPYARSADHFG